MQHRRQPADVPAVARRECRQQPDRGVLGRMCRSSQPDGRERQLGHHLVGHQPPHRLGRHAVHRQVERGGVPDVAGHRVTPQIAGDLVGKLDHPVADHPASTPSPGEFADDVHLGDAHRLGVIGQVQLFHHRHRLGRQVTGHQPLLALVQVDGPFMHRPIGGAPVDAAHHAPGAGLDDLDRTPDRPTQVDGIHRAFGTRPEPAGGSGAQQPLGAQPGRKVAHRLAEPALVARFQRSLLGGRRQVRSEHVGVLRAQHRLLDRPVEDQLRMVEQVRVQRVVAGHQHHQRVALAAARPAGLLPERLERPRETGDHHGIQAGDVDPQLQGIGGRHPRQFTIPQPRLKLTAVTGQVAGPVARHPASGFDTFGGPQRDQFGLAAAGHEGDHLLTVVHQPGQQFGRLSWRLGRRFPQDHIAGRVRGRVLVDLVQRAVFADQQRPGRPGVARGRRRQHEDRV